MTSKDDDLYGVVLAGGKSTRMGHDKTIIQWHGIEQKYHMAGLLEKLCAKSFISCRESQQGNRFPEIIDCYDDLGPLAAILSIFKTEPDKAWLVVAGDLPLMDIEALAYLIRNRNTNAIATAYESPKDGSPEPLAAIWEPAAYTYLLALQQDGFRCPRKVLMTHENVRLVKPLRPETLINANTPDDAAYVKSILNVGSHVE